MVSKHDEATDLHWGSAERGRRFERPRQSVRPAIEQPSWLVGSAMRFASQRHAGQRRDSDGAPFIAHPTEVARLLRDAGCSVFVIAAGLLHDVLENTDARSSELTVRFGVEVAELVRAVSDDAAVDDYRERKQLLREQVQRAGGDAALIFAADKISKVRELAHLMRGDQARPARSPSERLHDRLRLEHYQESLRMLRRMTAEHPLVTRLADELENVPMTSLIR